MLERTLVRKIKFALEDAGAKVIKHHGSQFSRAGTPDLLGCYRGYMIAIEVKVHPNKPTVLQEQELTQWAQAGAYTAVAYCIEDAQDVITRINRREQ